MDVQQKTAELKAANAAAQAKIKQSSEQVARVQQEARKKQQGEYQAYNQKVQEISSRYAGQFNTSKTIQSLKEVLAFLESGSG